MKYRDYSADDLIKDEYFQQWVFSPTEETNRFWIDFLDSYPQHRERVEEARQFLSFFHVKDKDVFESRISNLKKRITQSIDHPSPQAPPAEVKLEKKTPLRISPARTRRIITAVLMLILGVIAVVIPFYSDDITPIKPEEASDHREIVAPRGKRELVVLGDGTRVFLNADSRIRYLKDFNSGSSREVYLEGQAYFEVSENLQKPFIVQTTAVKINGVAGGFAVSAYPEVSWVEVILVDGKVSLESKLQPLNQASLAPHQRVRFEKETENMSFDNQVDAAHLTAWRSGRLVFDNQSLRDIKSMLERWYDVTITFQDQRSLGCYFSGQFDNKTLAEVLTLLKTSEAVTFKVNGRQVTIYGKLCE